MRELQKRINELQPYVKEFKFQDGYTIVLAEMPTKWAVLPSQTIGIESAEEKKLFFSNKEDIGVDDILDYIEEVIKYNREEEMKAELLRLKMEELGVLFHNNSLEVLKTLEFVVTRNEAVVEEPVIDNESENNIVEEEITEEENEEA